MYPETSNNRYRISGLPNQGYEAGRSSGVNKVLNSIFNPADFLYKMFGKNASRLWPGLKKMKEDDEIRNQLG